MRNKMKTILTLLILLSLIPLNTSAQEDEPYLLIVETDIRVGSIA